MRKKSAENLLQDLEILLADGNAYMRRLTRTMLINLGAKAVIEVADGPAALEAIRKSDMEVMRIVRAPDVFPCPNIPTIMLTNHASQSVVTRRYGPACTNS